LMVARKPPAASLPCCFSAFPFVSLSLSPLYLFPFCIFSSSLSLALLSTFLAACSLVHWFHRCASPGPVFFSLIIPLRAIARVN
jgi:hypothetical protein